MNYNISFDIATIAILSVLWVALRTVVYTDSLKSAIFRRFVAMTLINAVLDILTAYTIAYASEIPDFLNLLLNTIYQYSSAFTVYYAIRYVFVYLDCATIVNVTINHILGASFLSLLFINMFTGWVFKFSDHTYVHGPLFFATYILSFMVVLHAFVTLLIRIKSFDKQKSRIVLFFLTLPIVFSITQMLIGDVLLTAFGEAFASMIMLFSLETPNYNKLISTMEELRIAKNEANIANNSKSDFLASMSHEIRTPINGILGMDTMILRECEDPQIVEYAENIKIAGNGLLSIINDILDLSKIESGKMELIPAEYELFSILNDCYQMLRMRAAEKGLVLNFINNPNIPSKLIGDEVRIRQIINNLLSNGIKYTEHGNVTLTVDIDDSTNSESDDDIYLIIKVSDTGIGIKDEDKEKLFQSFSRLEEKRNRNIEGTGLGLRITEQLVSLMNGTINVDSEYGKGSVFIVKIWQKAANNTPMGKYEGTLVKPVTTVQKDTDIFKAPGKKVLVVDDVKMNILVFKGLLKGTEIEIDTAISGAECLEKAAIKKYDIIFMDHLMPEMDGIEAFHRLQGLADNPNCDTPVVVLTANAVVGAKEMYLKEGFSNYLSKPVEQSKLLNMVKNCLQ